MITATIFEAKTKLSELIKKSQNGETVIITSGRAKTPVARLEPIRPATKKKRIGAFPMPDFVWPESFWDPLPEGWNGDED